MAACLDAVDAATAPAQVTADVSLEIVWCDVLHLHDRLEQNRAALLESVFYGKDGSQLESQLVRVHVVIAPVDNIDFDVDHRVTAEHTVEDGFFDALFDRGDVRTGNGAANDLVVDDQPCAARARPNVHFDVTVLAATA